MINTREKLFYTQGGVPDTFDGRFDLLLIHLFIIFHILMTGTSHKNKAVLQALFDRMLEDMDQTLREMGAGDTGVSRQVRRMMDAFYGRVHAYQDAISGEDTDEALEQALIRNLYGTLQKPVALESLVQMKDFIQINIENKSPERIENIVKGHIVFDNHVLNREKRQDSSTPNETRYDRINKN